MAFDTDPFESHRIGSRVTIVLITQLITAAVASPLPVPVIRSFLSLLHVSCRFPLVLSMA